MRCYVTFESITNWLNADKSVSDMKHLHPASKNILVRVKSCTKSALSCVNGSFPVPGTHDVTPFVRVERKSASLSGTGRLIWLHIDFAQVESKRTALKITFWLFVPFGDEDQHAL